VTFHNKDQLLHTFTGVLGTWGNYKEYEEGGSVTYSFDKAGVYPYFCELHPGMAGAIVVGDGSAAADTSADSGISVVSAVSGGQADAATSDAAQAAEDDGRSTAGIIAGIAALGAVLGLAAVAPIALRSIRARS
jgi:hypothetical protein